MQARLFRRLSKQKLENHVLCFIHFHKQALHVDLSHEILTNSFGVCSCNVGNLVKDQNENVRAYP